MTTAESLLVFIRDCMLAGSSPVAVGYINSELLSEKRVTLAVRSMYAWADLLDMSLMEIHIETSPWRQTAFLGALDEVTERGARYVIVPDLRHLSSDDTIRRMRLDRIQHDGTTLVLPMEPLVAAQFVRPDLPVGRGMATPDQSVRPGSNPRRRRRAEPP